MGSHVFLHLLRGSFTHIFVGLSLTLHFSRFWGPKVLVEPIKFDDLYVRWKSLSTICLGCCFTSKTPCFFNGWKAFHPKGSNVGTTLFPEGGFFFPTSRVSMKNALETTRGGPLL